MVMEVTLNNGLKMPSVGLGTYLITNGDECKTIVKESLRIGYRLIDTATAYRNEQFIGDVISNHLKELSLKREDIFITTKIAPKDQGKGLCRNSVLDSLEKLQTPYIDLVLIHWPGASGLDHSDHRNSQMRKESYDDLEELCREGSVKSIGVSNYMIPHLKELMEHCTIRPAVNQVEFHPLLFNEELLDYCKKNEIYFQAYSSLGAAKGWSILSNNDIVVRIAKKCNKSVPQILLKWALQNGVGIIPKTSRVQNLKPNFDLWNFEISSEDMQLLNGLNENRHFCWDPNTIK